MRNFKAQVERDIMTVFHNSRDHADVLEFRISCTRSIGSIMIVAAGALDRKKPSTDHADGLILFDLVLYVPLSLLKRTPKKGEQVEIDDMIYTIKKVHPEAGDIVLYLEGLDE